MQKSTNGKELAIRKEEIRDLLKEAIAHHKFCEAARGSVLSAQQIAMWHGWQTGIRLNGMKELIGSGNWQDWLDLNFCQRADVTIRTAQLYMKIDNDNAELRDEALKTQRVAPAKADFQLLTRLKFDTIRKYAIGFVPEKDQPEHHGNVKFPRLVSFLNIVNEFARLKQRHVEGLQLVDFNEAREETSELYHFLRWLHHDAQANPWEAAPPI
jgi:hypothetical protein